MGREEEAEEEEAVKAEESSLHVNTMGAERARCAGLFLSPSSFMAERVFANTIQKSPIDYTGVLLRDCVFPYKSCAENLSQQDPHERTNKLLIRSSKSCCKIHLQCYRYKAGFTPGILMSSRLDMLSHRENHRLRNLLKTKFHLLNVPHLQW